MHEFGVLNWTILGGYIALTLLLGAVVGKKVTSASQFALGDTRTEFVGADSRWPRLR